MKLRLLAVVFTVLIMSIGFVASLSLAILTWREGGLYFPVMTAFCVGFITYVIYLYGDECVECDRLKTGYYDEE